MHKEMIKAIADLTTSQAGTQCQQGDKEDEKVFVNNRGINETDRY
jgi:hypothetical protein